MEERGKTGKSRNFEGVVKLPPKASSGDKESFSMGKNILVSLAFR
jgi:hypothetical protein